MNTVFFISVVFFTNECYKHINFIKYIDQCNIVSFSLMLQYAFSQNPDWSQSPLYSFSWHTCSIDTRIHVFRNYRKETGKTKVFATVYSTVHEHTEKPVENISIVSSEALLSVKLRVYGIAKIRPIQQSRTQTQWDEMRWSPDGSWEWVVVIGPCGLRQQSFGTDTRPMTERVRTFNSTTLKMRALFKTTCIQARRMVKEALWWNPESKQSRQWWASISSLFLVCWINRHSECDYRGYDDYKSVIQVKKTQLSHYEMHWCSRDEMHTGFISTSVLNKGCIFWERSKITKQDGKSTRFTFTKQSDDCIYNIQPKKKGILQLSFLSFYSFLWKGH